MVLPTPATRATEEGVAGTPAEGGQPPSWQRRALEWEARREVKVRAQPESKVRGPIKVVLEAPRHT